MNHNILIMGKGGFIAERLRETFQCNISGAWINTLAEAEAEIKKYSPDIVINCIGYTGKRNVDDCELEKEATLQANTFLPIILAEACLRNNVKLVHISSGCIYHYDYAHRQPLTELDIPDFFGLYYSRSKIYSERALEVLAKEYGVLILRIRIPLDNRNHPKNILNKLIAYKKVIDIPNSVTYIPDFIEALKHLLKTNANGIYNVVNKTPLRYPELMDVFKKYNPDFSYELLKLSDLKLVRTNLVMSTDKLEKTGFKVRPIQDVLDECVRGYLGAGVSGITT